MRTLFDRRVPVYSAPSSRRGVTRRTTLGRAIRQPADGGETVDDKHLGIYSRKRKGERTRAPICGYGRRWRLDALTNYYRRFVRRGGT